MASFLASLPAGHSIRSATTIDLATGLRAEPLINGPIPAALNTRKEWAAAAEYLNDATIVVDVASVMGLSPGQRTTLCAMLGAASSSDAQTAAARIVRMFNSVVPIRLQVGQQAAVPTPWRDALVAWNYAQLGAADVLTDAEIGTRLSSTPFDAVQAGLGSAQLKEVGYCAIWAHEYLTDQVAWDSLSPILQTEIRGHLGVATAVAADWARTACIAICSAWRGISTGQLAARSSFQQQAQPQSPSLVGVTVGNPATNAAPIRRTVTLPQRILAEAVIGGEDAWWVEAVAGGAGGSKVEWSGHAQNNVLTPFHLGDPTVMGSSVWEPIATGRLGALKDAVASGVGSNDTPSRREDLQAILMAAKCTFVDAELLIGSTEATALKAGRKQETATRRLLAPSLSSYPWLQTLGVMESTKAGSDSLIMGRQIAVALRSEGVVSLNEIQGMVRQVRADKFQAIYAQFDAGWTALNPVVVISAMDAFKVLVKDRITVAFNAACTSASTFPDSLELREICAGRHQQLIQLPALWDQLSGKLQTSEASGGASDDSDLAFRMGWIKSLFDGARASTSIAASMRATFVEIGGGFSSTPVASSAGSSSGGQPAGSGGAAGTGTRSAGAPAAAGSTGGTPRSKGTPRGMKVGVHLPASIDVVGDCIGIPGPTMPCWNCKQQGHSQGECPVAYGRLGHALPGWDKDGVKIPAAWHADEPKRATYKAWLSFFKNKRIFSSGQAERSGLRNAPTLDQFQERADNARA